MQHKALLRLILVNNDKQSMILSLDARLSDCPKKFPGTEPKSEPSSFRTVGQARLGSAVCRTNHEFLSELAPLVWTFVGHLDIGGQRVMSCGPKVFVLSTKDLSFTSSQSYKL